MKTILSILFLVLSAATFAQDSSDLEFLKLVNDLRKGSGLAPLQYDKTLDTAVTIHANWMQAANKMTHDEFEIPGSKVPYFVGSTHRLQKADPNWTKVFWQYGTMENCFAVRKTNADTFGKYTEDSALIKYVFDCWVHSPGHKAALMSPTATHIAFGISIKYDESTKESRVFACCMSGKKL